MQMQCRDSAYYTWNIILKLMHAHMILLILNKYGACSKDRTIMFDIFYENPIIKLKERIF